MPNEAKHTPGPWRVLDEPRPSPIYNALICMIKSADDGMTAVATVGGRMAHSSEWLANARLIAAAPDMLTALKAMVLNDTHTYRDCHKAALAAIAKAEGRS